MHHPTSLDLTTGRAADWHIGHADPWMLPQIPGGVAPSRHDLALARYLEKQAEHRASDARPAIGPVLIELCEWLARCWPAFHGAPGGAGRRPGSAFR